MVGLSRQMGLALLWLFVGSAHALTTANVANYLGANSPDVSSAAEAYYSNSSENVLASAVVEGYAALNAPLIVYPDTIFTFCSAGRLLNTLYMGARAALASASVQRDIFCGPRFGWSSSTITGVDMSGDGYIFGARGEQTTLHLTGNLYLNHVIGCNDGSIVFDGNGNTLTIAEGGRLLAYAGGIALRNMNLVITTTGGIFGPMVAGWDHSLTTLENVNIYLPSTLNGDAAKLFRSSAGGSLMIRGEVTVNGPGQTLDFNTNSVFDPVNYAYLHAAGFVSSVEASLFIDDNSLLTINDGVTFVLSSDLTPINKKLYLKGSGSILHLNNCTFCVPTALTYPGIQLERGMVVFQNRVVIDNQGNTVVAKGLILGDGGSSANDVSIAVEGGAHVVVDGCLYHKPV